MAANPLAIQLYTVREMAAKDFAGTLRAVADAGYGAVEFAGYAGLTAPQMSNLLDDTGLRVAGTHVGLEALEQEFDATASYASHVKTEYLVVGGAAPEYRTSADGWKRFAERMQAAGEKCKAAGFILCYHNHSFEFDQFGGRTGYDILFETADKALVNAEVDTFWVKYAGVDPVATVSKLAGRVPLLHLKDQSKTNLKHDCEVAEGTLDWNAIFDAARKAGTQWFIVEQEDFERPVIDCIRTSAKNLKRFGF